MHSTNIFRDRRRLPAQLTDRIEPNRVSWRYGTDSRGWEQNRTSVAKPTPQVSAFLRGAPSELSTFGRWELKSHDMAMLLRRGRCESVVAGHVGNVEYAGRQLRSACNRCGRRTAIRSGQIRSHSNAPEAIDLTDTLQLLVAGLSCPLSHVPGSWHTRFSALTLLRTESQVRDPRRPPHPPRAGAARAVWILRSDFSQ